jgi:hypothetical protein
VAKGARQAAQDAREAVRAQALAEAVEGVSRDVDLLAAVAQQGNCAAFALLGNRVVAVLWAAASRHRVALGSDRATDLQAAARQLQNGLSQIPKLRGAPTDEERAEVLVSRSLGVQKVVAEVAGSLRGTSDNHG